MKAPRQEKGGKSLFTRADFAGFALGLLSLWAQVVLLRRLLAAFSGNELTIALLFFAWMVWTGLFSWWWGPFSDRLRFPALALAVVFLLCGLLVIPTVLVSGRIKFWLGVGPGEIVGLPVILFASLLLTAPLCALLGFGFNLATRMQTETISPAGRTYGFEALGACFTGVILTIWFREKANPLLPALVISPLFLVSAIFLLKRDTSFGRATFYLAVVSIFLVFAFSAFAMSGGRGASLLSGEPARVGEWLDSFDSRRGYVAVTRQGEEITVFEDGVPAATFPQPAVAEVRVHLPLAMCEKPERVLLISAGLSNLGAEILKHPVRRLDYVQMDPGWLALEKQWVPRFRSLVSDSRVMVHVADPRAWLRGRQAEFDAVILDLSDPLTASGNRFYTKEFFGEVKSALRPGGVFSLVAGVTPPNRAYTPAQLGLLAKVMTTVEAVFPAVVLLPLETNLIVAGDPNTALTQDPEKIERTLLARGLHSYYAGKNMIASDLVPDLLHELEEKLKKTPTTIDRDLHPQGYLFGIMLWAEQTSPAMRKVGRAWLKLPAGVIFLLPAILLFLFAGLARKEGVVMAGTSGFVSMVVSVLVLIAFQMRCGSVYFGLAFLSAVFMMGLSLGATAESNWREWLGVERVAWLPLMSAGFCLLVVWGLMQGEVGGMMAWLGFSLSLLVAGTVAGIVFSAAGTKAIAQAGEVGRGAGWINAGEHFGSALGALLAGALLVPRLGLHGSLLSLLLPALFLPLLFLLQNFWLQKTKR